MSGIKGTQIRDETLTSADIAQDAIGASEIASGSITGQPELGSANGNDFVLISNTNDSGNLKKVQVQNLSSQITHLTEHGYYNSGSSLAYIPWYQTSEKTSPHYLDQYIAPFNGRLKKVLLRSSHNSMGSTAVSIHINVNQNATISANAEETVTITVAQNTTSTFNFSNNDHFAQGDIVGISIDPTGNHGNVNVTCVWEYFTD
tara:strand:- start:458 stop:1066 length:609 start_codon:yes stop_codon:yes gene_type:complete